MPKTAVWQSYAPVISLLGYKKNSWFPMLCKRLGKASLQETIITDWRLNSVWPQCLLSLMRHFLFHADTIPRFEIFSLIQLTFNYLHGLWNPEVQCHIHKLENYFDNDSFYRFITWQVDDVSDKKLLPLKDTGLWVPRNSGGYTINVRRRKRREEWTSWKEKNPIIDITQSFEQ